MNNTRKHILISCLLIMAAAPFVAPMVLLIQQQYVIYNMEEELERKSLHNIRIAQNHVQWVVDDKECIIDGRMFDVKSIEENGSQLLLTGLFDDEETMIVRHLESSGESSGNGNKKAQIIYGFTHLTAVENKSEGICIGLIQCISDKMTEHRSEILAAHTLLLTPPPNNI